MGSRTPDATCTAQKLASVFEGTEGLGEAGEPPSFTMTLG